MGICANYARPSNQTDASSLSTSTRKRRRLDHSMAIRLSEETVQKELLDAGLRVTETLTFLPYQYMLIAQPTTAAGAPSESAGH